MLFTSPALGAFSKKIVVKTGLEPATLPLMGLLSPLSYFTVIHNNPYKCLAPSTLYAQHCRSFYLQYIGQLLSAFRANNQSIGDGFCCVFTDRGYIHVWGKILCKYSLYGLLMQIYIQNSYN